jgi:methionyl-tRNA formyltransferase
MALRVLFFGTPRFAVPSLDALMRSPHQVVGVVTQPDRPRGRGHKVHPEAVKLAALGYGLPVRQPERMRDPGLLAGLAADHPDVAVVAAYGRLLPQALLDVPRLGCVNVHASLLPRWRGAAPVHRAILAGDAVTGVTIMRVVLALDAGPMIARASTPIEPDETSVELEARLAAMGANLLTRVLDDLERGVATELPQNDADATYAPKLERADGVVDWTRPAPDVHNRVRGLHPGPLAAATVAGRRILLLRSAVEHLRPESAAPGTIVDARADGLVIATNPGAVRLLEIQPEGRRPMTTREFLNGTRVAIGDRFQ